MKVLVGCEESGVVRRAFEALGHDAYSCDLEPSEDNSPKHIQDDVRNVLHLNWDIGIFHPPCTRLSNSSVRWLKVPPPGRTLEELWDELEKGCMLFQACWEAPIDKVAVENPIMNPYARERIRSLPKPQIVQPWWFGEKAFKATGLYLKNLPKLVPTNKLTRPEKGTEEHKKWSFIHRASPGPNRAKLRSRTFVGIAEAMAAQWG